MARLTIDSLKYVQEALFDVRNSWYDIGVQLNVSPTTLDNIKTQSDSNSDCLREMLKVWLKGLDCSWKVIVAALNSKVLREKTGALATEIEKEYCTEAAVVKAALNTTGSIQEGPVAELQAELKKLKSEVSALKTQQKLDQGDFSSVAELTPNSGIDISAKGSFVITSDKAHNYELKHLGLQIHVPEDALPPGVTETTVHVQASLSGQYCMPDGFELASAVYWFSAPVKFSHPVTVKIQHNAASEDPSSKLCFTICKCPMSVQLGLPYTFEKMEGGGFTRRNGSITVPGFSGLGIIMPKGGPQYYLSQLWYAKKSERDWTVYYVITKDLVALKSAVEACYSDEACQGKCARVDFEGSQIMMDIPMEGMRTEEWTVTPLYSPTIQKEDAKSFSSRRLPVCELAVHWDGTFASDMPARFTLNINLLGAKTPGSVVLDIETGHPQYYRSQLWYTRKSVRVWTVYYVITKDTLEHEVEAYYSNIARQGICTRVNFEGSQIMMNIPMEGIRIKEWKITPLYSPVIEKEDANSFSSKKLPVCELAVHWGGTYVSLMPARFTLNINLLGAEKNDSVILDIETVSDVTLLKLFYIILDDRNCDVYCVTTCEHHNKLTEAYTRDLGAVAGPEMKITFQSHEISVELPEAVSGWRIIPLMPNLQISQAEVMARTRSPQFNFRVRQDPNTQEPLSMDLLLKGAKPPNNIIRVFLDPSVWGAQKSLAIMIQQEEFRKKKRDHESSRLHHIQMVSRELSRHGSSDSASGKIFAHLLSKEVIVPPEDDDFTALKRKLDVQLAVPRTTFATTLPIPSEKWSSSNLQGSKKWYQLGIQLDIDHTTLDAIGKASAGDDEKLICVLYEWMHSDKSPESITPESIN